MVLRAVKHVNVDCPSKTKYVIFYATKWDSIVWLKNRNDFQRVTVILKLVLLSPQALKY